MLIASNQSLAEFNLTKEPDLVSGKERLCEMYEEAEKLYKSVTEKVNTLSKYNYLNFQEFYHKLSVIILTNNFFFVNKNREN